jgi:hypothetical protein
VARIIPKQLDGAMILGAPRRSRGFGHLPSAIRHLPSAICYRQSAIPHRAAFSILSYAPASLIVAENFGEKIL